VTPLERRAEEEQGSTATQAGEAPIKRSAL